MITSTKAIFHREETALDPYANFIEFVLVDEGGNGYPERVLKLRRSLVNDMEWPDTITVTIEVGDTLNVDPNEPRKEWTASAT